MALWLLLEANGSLRRTVRRWGLAGVAVFVLTLTVSFPKERTPAPWNYVSSLLGWTYFCAWSISFYPQVLLLWHRKSSEGLSFDFVWLNALGFVCYFIYAFSFYASPAVQQSYSERNNGTHNLVALNDVVFAGHASCATFVTLVQMYLCGYVRAPGSHLSSQALAFFVVVVGTAILYSVAVAANGDGQWKRSEPFVFHNMLTWLSVLYFLSMVKLVVSTIKYMPQAYMNYTRRSTVGWSIGQVLLDFTGGTLSIMQLIVDGGTTNNWAGVVGNPVKFGLGFVSMLFDIIFMVQHYVLYPAAGSTATVEHRPLTSRDGNDDDFDNGHSSDDGGGGAMVGRRDEDQAETNALNGRVDNAPRPAAMSSSTSDDMHEELLSST